MVIGSFPSAQPEARIPELAQQLLALLREQADLQIALPPVDYAFPPGRWFGHYLFRLEQLLALRCASMEGVPEGFMHGEREIIGGNLELCLAHPQYVSLRFLLIQTLLSMKRVRPQVMREYFDRVALLQKEYPLPQPAHGVAERLIGDVFRE